jgi:threonylcarbamoyladenosine tRNA methylthiotransferase MtaB
MQETLTGAGYQVVPFDGGADLVIVNTCTVTNATDAQSRNLIRRARRINPACRVIVTGCYAQVDPAALAEMPGVSLVIGNEEKQRLLEFLQCDGVGTTVEVTDIRQVDSVCLPPLTSFAGRSRAFVQIQNGCDAFCSYCIIPYARGASRSAGLSEVVHQVQSLSEAGYPEIVLTGIHIGGYGADLTPKSSLTELVQHLHADTDIGRLRLGSIEPTEISDAFIELIADSQIVCPHFHIPLQAGDDAVLQRMGRDYDRAFFRDLVERIHKRIPRAAIGLDVITGFPGETETEFINTYDLIDNMPVSHLHVFPYSKRPGTPAAQMPDQVPGDVSKARAERLRHLGKQKLETFAAQFLEDELDVIVESGTRNGLLKGVSRNYLDVQFAGPDSLSGLSARVRIMDCVDGALMGELSEMSAED